MTNTNQLAANREQHMTTIKQSLKVALTALSQLPDDVREPAQEALLNIWRKNLAMADLLQQSARHMAEADATILGTTEALRQVKGQRDQVLAELDGVVQALAQVYGDDDAFVADLRGAVDNFRQGQ